MNCKQLQDSVLPVLQGVRHRNQRTRVLVTLLVLLVFSISFLALAYLLFMLIRGSPAAVQEGLTVSVFISTCLLCCVFICFLDANDDRTAAVEIAVKACDKDLLRGSVQKLAGGRKELRGIIDVISNFVG